MIEYSGLAWIGRQLSNGSASDFGMFLSGGGSKGDKLGATEAGACLHLIGMSVNLKQRHYLETLIAAYLGRSVGRGKYELIGIMRALIAKTVGDKHSLVCAKIAYDQIVTPPLGDLSANELIERYGIETGKNSFNQRYRPAIESAQMPFYSLLMTADQVANDYRRRVA